MADDVHELAAPYALDALDGDELRRFEAHLEGCARCRADVDGFRTATTALAFAQPAPAPPGELRERILTAARAERPNVVPLRPRRAWVVPAAASLAAVASVAAVALAAWGISTSHSLARERAALSVIGDPHARRLPVRGARGALYVAPSGEAVLAVDLARPPKGKTYEAWVMDPQPRRAGLFSGKTTKLSRRVPSGATVAVTLEHAEGVDAPTSKALLTVRA